MSEYTGTALLLGLNMGFYLLIFYMLQNISIDIEKHIMYCNRAKKKDPMKSIRTELNVQLMLLGFVLVMNLILCGYIYHFSGVISAALAKMSMIYILFNLLAFTIFSIAAVVKVFTFPAEAVKEVLTHLEKQKKQY